MSQDIGDFLKEEIRGPASFSCVTGSGWKFEEPAMNDLTDSVFRVSILRSSAMEGDVCIIVKCPVMWLSRRSLESYCLLKSHLPF